MAENTKKRYHDYAAELRAVDANIRGLQSPLGSEWWPHFVTVQTMAKIEAALDKAGIPFSFTYDPTIENRESRLLVPVYTLGSTQFHAGQILAVMWENEIDQPGTLYLDGGVLKFRPDPVAPPAPRPNPGNTSAADVVNDTPPPNADFGAFTREDRADLKAVKQMVALLLGK